MIKLPNIFWFLEHTKDNVEQLNDLPLSLESRVILYKTYDGQGANVVVIKEAYKIIDNGPLVQNALGIWSPDLGGMLPTPSSPIWERRRNLQGLTFSAVVLPVNKMQFL